MEHRSGISFPVHSYSWEPLSELQLTAGQLCTTQLEGPSFTSVQWKGGPWNWALWWLCVLSPPLPFHAPSLEGKRSWSLGGHCFLLFVFFFFAKGLLPVSELWLLPPKLSLQLQCTDGLRGCVYMCVRTCVCILGRGVYF